MTNPKTKFSSHHSVSTKGKVVPSLTADSCPAVTLSQRTDAISMGLDLVLEHHGAPSLIREELIKQLHSYLDISKDEKVWLTRTKYVLTYPLAKYLKNPLPVSPDRVFRPAGSLKRWLKARFNAFNRKNTHFWYSWYQSKRSSLPLSCDIIEATYEKHFETLTRVDPGDDEIIGQIMNLPIFDRLLSQLTEQVSTNFAEDVSFTKRNPTGSACYEGSRRMKGQFGELQRLSGVSEVSFGSDLWSMRFSPRAISSGRLTFNLVTETRVSLGYEDWESLDDLTSNQVFFSSFQEINAIIQGILEPNKVRVISKGEALPYYSCKPLQVAMHSALRKLDPFRLIGRPFSPTDMIDLGRMSSQNHKWFSIDYSAATDGLSWKYSGAIFRRLIEKIPYEQRILAESVLGPHRLSYPNKNGRGKVTFKGVQKNGQLMGSILSFPILCLANLGVYLLVTNEFQTKWTDQQRLSHVLVNGDDMVYSAPESLWEKHVDIAGKVGLEMSVGKAYIHPVYANINSTSVHYDLRNINSDADNVFDFLEKEKTRPNVCPYQIDFLNTGLFFGQRKVQDSNSKEGKSFLRPMEELEERKQRYNSTLTTEERLIHLLKKEGIDTESEDRYLCSSLNEVIKGSLPGKQKDIMAKFLSTHKDELKLECLGLRDTGDGLKVFTRNLFLPQSLGGMGVDRPLGFSTKLKKIHMEIAACCLDKMTIGGLISVSTQSPSEGYPVNEIDRTENVPWRRKIGEPNIFGMRKPLMSKVSKKKIWGMEPILYAVNPSLCIIK